MSRARVSKKRAAKEPTAKRTIRTAVAALAVLTAACAGGEANTGAAQEFPDFELDDLRDRSRTIRFEEDVEGEPTVVNFFASWCAPCKRELPLFADAFERHGARVQFLGVDTEDSASEAVEMLDRYRIGYPAAYDPDATLRNALGRRGLPITAFVSADGTVSKLISREVTAAELEAEIEELLKASR